MEEITATKRTLWQSGDHLLHCFLSIYLQFGDDDMVFYDPVFGICFLPEILTTVGRIHISRKKHTGETDVLDLDSDAEHQSEKSEHPV